ncbi:MAG: hypothetical protein RIM80_09245, partial [Alphaproteobacteria bacterium]
MRPATRSVSASKASASRSRRSSPGTDRRRRDAAATLRLVRYGAAEAPRPGLLDPEGRLRDLSYVVYDIDPELLGPDDLDVLRSIEPVTLPQVEGRP